MTTKEIIELLETYNAWRRGAEIPQPDPVEIGKAIEVAIEKLQNKCEHKQAVWLTMIAETYCPECREII
jgi:Zn finger protein HypA/HybF involved in hydrogenase expression